MFPTLFQIGNFEVSTFGLMVAAGLFFGGELGARSFERVGLDREAAWRIVTWGAIGGILGSKLWYAGEQVIRDLPGGFLDHFLSRAGMTWYGGLVGGAALGIASALRQRLSLLQVVNCAAPSVAIGQAIGRIGCLLVGDDYGRVTDVPWGIAFPRGLPPIDQPVHPTQIYESFWLFAVSAWLWRRRGRSTFLFGEYLLLAGLGRFGIEFVRNNPPLVGSLTNAQLTAVVCMLLGIFGWIYAGTRARISSNAGA